MVTSFQAADLPSEAQKGRRPACAVAALLLAAVVGLAVETAAAEPARRCAAAKLMEAGKYFSCRAKATDASGAAACDERFHAKWALAENQAGLACPSSGDAATIRGSLTQFATDLTAAIGGGPAPVPHYIDNGDGTITDTSTGLMWEKHSDDGSIHDQDDAYSWTDAFASKIATLNAAMFAGYSDWRVPNLNELHSITILLTHATADNTVVRTAFNSGCAPGCTALTCSCSTPSFANYWTSTSYHGDPSHAWTIDFLNGSFTPFPKSDDRLAVRAVRDAW